MSSPDHADRGHSKLGASGASRWLACPASVRHLQENPKPGGLAASDGTKTHELSEMLLRSIFDKSGETLPSTVEPDRMERIKSYVNFCVELSTDLESRFGSEEVEHAIEARFHMEELHPLFYGTNDFALWVDWEELHVIDLKDGYGAVSAEENAQLMFYAAGIIRKYNLQVDRIFVHIYQPKLDNPHSVDELRMRDITEFERKLVDGAERALAANPEYVPGDKQCQWCNTAVCPARQEHLQEKAGLAFPEDDELTMDLPPVGEYTTDRLLHLQKFEGAFKQLFSDIHEELFIRAQKGEEIPDRKLVKKLGNTTWKDPDHVATLAEEWGVDQEEMFTKKLKSPTQMKKLVKDKKLVDQESYRPDNGVALVSSSSKGVAITPGNFNQSIDGLD